MPARRPHDSSVPLQLFGWATRLLPQRMKPHLARRRRGHHLAQDFGNLPDFMVVQLNGVAELLQLLDNLARRRQEPTKLNEDAHDFDVDFDRQRRVQNAAEHGDALLGENARRLAFSAVT